MTRAIIFIVATLIAAMAAILPHPAQADASAYCSGDQLAVGANWSVCWEVRANEGLVITQAFYKKPGLDQRVASGLAVAQVFVPYETGQPRYHDVAYGLGPAMQPLPAGSCDGTLLYGGRVCREVSDRGLSEFFCSEGNCHSRAGKGLVLWGSSQMGAYNYIIRWEFHDDGTIEPVFVLSGVLQFGNVDHTHNVFWRLDLDIDDAGHDNVEEFYRIVPAYSDGRSGAAGWTPLMAETYRANDLATFRRWRVVDTNQTNAQGSERSYEVDPNPADGNLRTVPEEGFTRGELFITHARDSERFVSTETSDLLSSYLNGESVADTDVVLWYVMHKYHHVRDEDKEYMPTEVMRFEIRPNGFFDSNPMD